MAHSDNAGTPTVVFTAADWRRACERRAQRRTSPPPSLRRGIFLRQSPDDRWRVELMERRSGQWSITDRICAPTTLPQARCAALSAWRSRPLPILWTYADDPGCRAFMEGVSEPQAVRS